MTASTVPPGRPAVLFLCMRAVRDDIEARVRQLTATLKLPART
jgi:hypothetical protein